LARRSSSARAELREPHAQEFIDVFISQAFAQTAPAPAGDPMGGAMSSIFFLLVTFGVLWLLMIRPQMKRQKEHKAMIEALAKGDEVVTAGGMVGRVSKLGEAFVHLEIANNTEIQVQRSAIVQVLPKGSFK
jgi:preprotein translocase subunit YajC